MTIDPVAHAYATIGVRPGASAQELKQRYKQLVKTWHPDRWANDPVNQAEATQKMRAINAAYAELHRVQTAPRVVRTPPSAPPREHPETHWSVSHRSMTDEELDAIVNAIGNESLVSGMLRNVAWMAPLAGAFVVCQPHKRADLLTWEPMRTRDVVMAATLFTTSIVVLLRQKWAARSGRSSIR